MSNLHLFLADIFVTTGPAKCIGHDNVPYTNPEFPEGTIYGVDIEGNLFAMRREYREIRGIADDTLTCWPERENDLIPLYRDHWRHVAPSNDAPYTKALLQAPKRKVSPE